jgi:hypothetical protein
MLRDLVGISNDLASLLYSRSSAEIITSRTPSAEIITSRTLVSSLDAMTINWHFSIINAAVQCDILRTFEEKQFFFTSWKKYPIFEELSLENCWIHKVRLGLKL